MDDNELFQTLEFRYQDFHRTDQNKRYTEKLDDWIVKWTLEWVGFQAGTGGIGHCIESVFISRRTNETAVSIP